MTYKDFIPLLQKQLSALSCEKGLEMVIILCRKMLPDYRVFSANNGWGDPGVLEEAMQFLEAAKAGMVNKKEIEPLSERLSAVTPDTEDFGNYDGSYALNAAGALWYGLQYLKGKDPKDLEAVGTLYTDTIYFQLHEMGIEDYGDIQKHSLMQEAWKLVLNLCQ